MPPPHRCFSLRNPFVRAVLLAATVLCLVALALRSDSIDARSAVLRAGSSAKQSVSAQRPLDGQRKSDFLPATEHKGEDTTLAIYTNTSHAMTCDYDMDRLRKVQQTYGLQEKFQYLKRYVRISRHETRRTSITKLRQNFLSNKFKTVDVRKKYGKEPCPEPLIVPVTRSPYPQAANASDFMFGVSTTYKRFVDPQTSPVHDWAYWLTDSRGHSNGGKLILMLLDASDDELRAVWEQLTTVGIDVDVYHSDSTLEMAVRYLKLVPMLYHHPDRRTRKWLVTCDDDTFFPSFNALAEKFDEYDHTRPMYIGAFSEDINNIARHGSQAFGGAGVFLSLPMAELITERYESCRSENKVRESDSGWGPQGDILLRKCIYENSETKLTLLSDLWQLDLYGDPSGFYESGLKPLSLHHYRGGGWHIAYPWHYTKIAHICGEDCTMQRFQTADDFIISTGFSIAHYPKGIDFDVNQLERTFSAAPEDKGWNLDFKFGPQRQSLHKTGRKASWDLQESAVSADGVVTQVYTRKHDDWRWKDQHGRAMSDVDGVIELVWTH